jgi:SAM-dependent methyltransferase
MLTLLYVLVLFVILLIAFTIGVVWWLYGQTKPTFHRGGPYVPSRPEIVKKMIELAKLNADDVVYDLGSGDGRIIFEAVQATGCRGVGIEIDPWLVTQSNERAQKLNLGDRATFTRKNFWNTDVSNASVIFLFQISFSMKKLEQKLRSELRPGARIVSNYFVFPNWQPAEVHENVRLYIR